MKRWGPTAGQREQTPARRPTSWSGTSRVSAVRGPAITGVGNLIAVALSLLAVSGCGEQDLYRPPNAPFQISGRVTLPAEAEDVDILGNRAYVAAGQGGLYAVDISDPDNPQLTHWADTKKFAESIVTAQTYDADGSPRGIAFVVDGTEGITTFDITDPDTVINFGQGTQAYDGKGIHFVQAPAITERYMLFLADSWRGVTVFLQIMDTPGALDFEQAGTRRIFTYGYTKSLTYADGYVYVAEDQMGVSVVDATGLPAGGLLLMENFDTPGEALDIVHDAGYLYVADGPYGLHIKRIEADHTLTTVAELPLTGDCQAIDFSEGIVFLAAEDAGLHLVDVRDPEHPEWLGNVPTSHALGVAVGDDNVVCIADRDEGLVVFRGPELPADFTAPGAITDLAARVGGTRSAILSWTAPGDDGHTGIADFYELRSSRDSLAVADWEAADEIDRRPFPAPSGKQQMVEVEGLLPDSTYFFALKTRDEAWNWSEISNIASVIMTAPGLADATVSPDSGNVGTLFTYSVLYADPEGDAPIVHDVIIDGIAHEMEQADTSSDYTQYVEFRYATTLDLGCHEFACEFDDGQQLVTTPVAQGPQMTADPFDFEMQLVSVGESVEFLMGSPETETGREEDEVQHSVTLTRDYYIADVEVTQLLYRTIMGENPSFIQCHTRPVSNVTWYDAVKFCNELSEHDGYPPAYTISAERYEEGQLVAALVTWDPQADGYRLPTEAEWEYACRAGATTSLTNGELTRELCEIDPLLDAVGWYCGNSDTGMGLKARAVAQKEPNAFGLYDMHGNVYEYCWDWYAPYPEGGVTDPTGPDDDYDGRRVRRGGYWDYYARYCRSASRGAFFPDSADDTTGFRLVRNAD